MGTHEDPWAPWVPMGSHGSPWVLMGSHGSPWVPMGSHGSPWVPMGSHGSPWGHHGRALTSAQPVPLTSAWRMDHTKIFRRTLAGFGFSWHQKVHFSTFSGKLTSRCTRNGFQNPSFCPRSLQNTFIMDSSISHQHISRTYFANKTNLRIDNLLGRSRLSKGRSHSFGVPI